MENGKNANHGILLGIAGLILTIIIAVSSAVWAIADLKAEIAELRGALYVHIGSHQHSTADASIGDEKQE